MRSLSKRALWLIGFVVSAVPLAMGVTISGTVKGPGGAPFQGAFVEALNMTTNITTDVLSHEDGGYTVPNLPAGTYRVSIRAVGYKAAAQNEDLQTADQNLKIDFSLTKGKVSWSDISVWQGRMLLPDSPGKNMILGPRGAAGGPCLACHGFQQRMATRRLNDQGWMGMVNYMRDDVVPFFDNRTRITDKMAGEAATYLSTVFGLNSTLPASPADLPGYGETVRKFSNKAMNIVYVEYPIPDQTLLPQDAYPSMDGKVWIEVYGNINDVYALSPKTGKMTTYTMPCSHPAGLHSAVTGPYGGVWAAEQGCNRVTKINPETGKITPFQDSYLPGEKWNFMGGSKHDALPVLIGGKLYVFSSGVPATRLDPSTGKFTHIPGVFDTYDVIEGPNGNIWFTSLSKNAPLEEVNPKTLKVMMAYHPPVDPAKFRSHRIKVTPEGVLWFTCYGNMVCRFDPATKAFKRYTPLGPNTSDYALGIGRSGDIWYSMTDLDTVQRLDPTTGKIVEYPFPHSAISFKKMFHDFQGRMWWASPVNGVVGYFYLAPSAKKGRPANKAQTFGAVG